MDFSPARDAQQTTSIFADNRAARPDVPGTVARGQVKDQSFTTGIEKLSSNAPKPAQHLVAFMQETDEAKAAGGTDKKSVMDTTVWLEKNPRKIDAKLLDRGQQQFGIYCSVCHGMDGGGNGLVNQRAQKLSQATWIQPSSLHEDTLYSDKYPDGKLFSTISNGIRKMPGYAGQIKAEDRWAIVAYIRALQKSQNASMDLVPKDKRADLEKEKSEVETRLKEEAAAAKKKEEESKKKNDAEPA
jgi:mono/diheme cytochrome c family protein